MAWVQTPTTSSVLVTLADAKTYLGVTVATYDDTITELIEGATKAMEQYVGRDLVSGASTIELDGTGKRWLWLPQPFATVTAIYQDSSRTFAAASLVTAADYNHEAQDAMVDYHSSVWTEGQRNVRVVGTVGFAAVPDDVSLACKIQVADFYSRWNRAKEGRDVISREGLEGWTQQVVMADGLVPQVRDMLAEYVAVRW